MAETPAQNSAKTPRGRPFAKGVSPNPGGRPKQDPELVEFCRAASLPLAQQLLKRAKAEGADDAFVAKVAELFWNRGWGKPTEHHELSGDVTFVLRDPFATPGDTGHA